jgi:hypothetical protein
MTYVLQTHNWFLFNDVISSLDYRLIISNRVAYFTVVHQNFPSGAEEKEKTVTLSRLPRQNMKLKISEEKQTSLLDNTCQVL